MVSTGEKKMGAFEEKKKKRQQKNHAGKGWTEKKESVFYYSKILPLESSIPRQRDLKRK